MHNILEQPGYLQFEEGIAKLADAVDGIIWQSNHLWTRGTGRAAGLRFTKDFTLLGLIGVKKTARLSPPMDFLLLLFF